MSIQDKWKVFLRQFHVWLIVKLAGDHSLIVNASFSGGKVEVLPGSWIIGNHFDGTDIVWRD